MRPALLKLLGYFILCVTTASFAQEQLLKDKFLGKMFVIRHFYQDSSLHYDNSGHLRDTGKMGSWTTAQFLVEKEELKNKSFELSGERTALGYDYKKDHISLFKLEDLRMEVDLPSAAMTQSALDELANQIFIDLKKEPDQVPDYWRDVVSRIGANSKRL